MSSDCSVWEIDISYPCEAFYEIETPQGADAEKVLSNFNDSLSVLSGITCSYMEVRTLCDEQGYPGGIKIGIHCMYEPENSSENCAIFITSLITGMFEMFAHLKLGVPLESMQRYRFMAGGRRVSPFRKR